MISYPPHLPLFDEVTFHRRDTEDRWANPLPVLPMIILSTLLFLVGLWGATVVSREGTLASLPPVTGLLIASLLPPFVLLLVIVLVPLISSPVWPYQTAIFSTPEDRKLRWNLAVVATAHVHYGHIAQAEWLGQMGRLSEEDRWSALGFIRRVHNRLDQMPVFRAGDLLAMLAAAALAVAVSLTLLHYGVLEAILHSIALLITTQLFLLYLMVQRWQHVRRLSELEEVFEQLLPVRPTLRERQGEQAEDEVDRWFREKERQLLSHHIAQSRLEEEGPK